MARIKKAVVLLVLIFVIGSIGGGMYMLNFALTPTNRGKNEPSSLLDMYKRYPFITGWMANLKKTSALKDTFIYNDQGIKLHAYFVQAPRPTRKTAVIVHGYTDNAIRMMHIGYLYQHDMGYNILLPDLQYHGRSGGKAIQMGWKDRLDVERWINVARAIFGGKADSTTIVVHGISMGAATTMCVSGDKLPSNVKCFVEDCGYTSVWDEFSGEIKNQFGLPEFPILYSANMLCDLYYKWSFCEASPLKQIKKCTKPMLFIHGDKDTFVPVSMVFPLYNAKPGTKEIWICHGAVHARSYLVNRKEYTFRVKKFTQEYRK